MVSVFGVLICFVCTYQIYVVASYICEYLIDKEKFNLNKALFPQDPYRYLLFIVPYLYFMNFDLTFFSLTFLFFLISVSRVYTLTNGKATIPFILLIHAGKWGQTFFYKNYTDLNSKMASINFFNELRILFGGFFKKLKEDMYDAQVLFFKKSTRPAKDELRELLEHIKKTLLKSLNLGETDEELAKKTDEERSRLHQRIKDLRNPNIIFNLVRRLPIFLQYKSKKPYQQYILSHILVVYNFFKTTIIALILTFLYLLYTVFFFKIQFLKQLSVWFVIGALFFWLISGFNFFLKRYQFGKFTSQIQRFWKRTNTCFWLIEGFLLLLFFYYYLNSSQEPLYMYDYSALNQEYLISLYTISLNIILLSIVIYFMYFTLLRINSNSWEQLSIHLIIISSFIFFSFFIETYQFYYVISVFNERLWVFNEEDNLWAIDVENPILRTKSQYFLVCLIAKYWHFLFIFLSWVFFVIKTFERKKLTYVLFGANLQNIIILYFLNLACYVQWFKWLYRRFFDLPYTWFFTNPDNKFLYSFFNEIKLLTFNLIHINANMATLKSVVYKSLTIWGVDSLCIWKFI